MAENIKLDYDGLVTNIAIVTDEALATCDFASVPPYSPKPGENYLETISGSSRAKSGYDVQAGMMVDVTETYGLYRDSKGVMFDRRELAIEWENGDSFELDLDEGLFIDGTEQMEYELARYSAQRILHAVRALLP